MSMKKEVRLKVYNKMLELLLEDWSEVYSLCFYIGEIWLKGDMPYIDNKIVFYPELFNQMPDKKFDENFWFDPEDKETRVKILKNAIEKTQTI